MHFKKNHNKPTPNHHNFNAAVQFVFKRKVSGSTFILKDMLLKERYVSSYYCKNKNEILAYY